LTSLFADGDGKADRSFGYYPAGTAVLDNCQIRFLIHQSIDLLLRPWLAQLTPEAFSSIRFVACIY
jgi:hypothetical protein